jgi:L-ascorbate metabolism protein UlaG (beta-lactamase superfamily)
MGELILPKSRRSVVHEYDTGVCLWEIDGQYLGDADGNFLSMEGRMNYPRVEAKMRIAANYWLDGKLEGKPTWLNGARQISQDEWEDQKARLLDGQIPDEVEAVRQAMNRGK